jgi:hypothetical protein
MIGWLVPMAGQLPQNPNKRRRQMRLCSARLGDRFRPLLKANRSNFSSDKQPSLTRSRPERSQHRRRGGVCRAEEALMRGPAVPPLLSPRWHDSSALRSGKSAFFGLGPENESAFAGGRVPHGPYRVSSNEANQPGHMP